MFRPKHTALAAAATVMALGGAGVAIAAGGGTAPIQGRGHEQRQDDNDDTVTVGPVPLRSRPERVRRLSDTTAGALRGAGGLLGDVAARSRYVGFSIEMGTS